MPVQSKVSLDNVYHERQKDHLCGKHALNNLLQHRAWSRQRLDDIAKVLTLAEIDLYEPHKRNDIQQMVACGTGSIKNRTAHGDYSVQVLQQALLTSGVSLLAPGDPDLQGPLALAPSGFLIHLGDHWFAVRMLQLGKSEVWVNLNSLLDKPQILSNEQVFRLKAGDSPFDGGLVFFVIGDLPTGQSFAKPVPASNTSPQALCSGDSDSEVHREKSWKAVAGRKSGRDGYQMGDVTRSIVSWIGDSCIRDNM
jgi:hypothetical protein